MGAALWNYHGGRQRDFGPPRDFGFGGDYPDEPRIRSFSPPPGNFGPHGPLSYRRGPPAREPSPPRMRYGSPGRERSPPRRYRALPRDFTPPRGRYGPSPVRDPSPPRRYDGGMSGPPPMRDPSPPGRYDDPPPMRDPSAPRKYDGPISGYRQDGPPPVGDPSPPRRYNGGMSGYRPAGSYLPKYRENSPYRNNYRRDSNDYDSDEDRRRFDEETRQQYPFRWDLSDPDRRGRPMERRQPPTRMPAPKFSGGWF